MGLSKDEIEVLADTRYSDGCLEDKLFMMLVGVAETYRDHLEARAKDHAAPYFGGSTPLEALIEGLRENLELNREGM